MSSSSWSAVRSSAKTPTRSSHVYAQQTDRSPEPSSWSTSATNVDWSRNQLAVFEDFQNGTGHTVIVARAGSGKTTTLLEALNYLPEGQRALLAAFGHDIAKELRARAPTHVDVFTLHQIGLRALNASPLWRRIPVDKTGAKLKRLIQTAISGLPDNPDRAALATVLSTIVSLAKNMVITNRADLIEMISSRGLEDELWPAETVAPYAAAVINGAIADRSQIDFDDMIWLPVVLGLPAPTYDVVLIDELQDVSLCQLRLAQMAAKQRIIGVGDDLQAIFSFRGADKNAIERVRTELNAKTLALSVSYRCPTTVIDLAKKYAGDIEARPGAPKGTVRYVDVLGMAQSAKPGDFVISRSNSGLARAAVHFRAMGLFVRLLGTEGAAPFLRLITTSRKRTLSDLRTWLQTHLERNEKRFAEQPNALANLQDTVETVQLFMEDCTTVDQLISTIKSFFAEKTGPNLVVLATAHRAKGQEANNVFVLRETFLRRPSQEEKNLYYVAMTRAKQTLTFVSGLYDDEEHE